LIDIQLGRWDVSNIVTVMRSVRAGSRPNRVTDALVPAGRYSPAQLEELAKEPDIRSLADSLVQWDSPFGPVLRRSILAGHGEADYSRAESELFVEYFVSAFEELDAEDPDDCIVRDQLRLQADMINVLGVLKQIDSRSHGMDEPGISRIPGGFIGPSEIAELHASENMELALETLDGTEFAPAVERGILAFGETDRLSVLERFLETVVFDRGMRLFRKNPLNISVPIGFIWRKLNEFMNLRILARGKRYKLPTAAIREEMFLV
jgi:vacuolar-type H+-ATPase subunit C/Vma6